MSVITSRYGRVRATSAWAEPSGTHCDAPRRNRSSRVPTSAATEHRPSYRGRSEMTSEDYRDAHLPSLVLTVAGFATDAKRSTDLAASMA